MKARVVLAVRMRLACAICDVQPLLHFCRLLRGYTVANLTASPPVEVAPPPSQNTTLPRLQTSYYSMRPPEPAPRPPVVPPPRGHGFPPGPPVAGPRFQPGPSQSTPSTPSAQRFVAATPPPPAGRPRAACPRGQLLPSESPSSSSVPFGALSNSGAWGPRGQGKTCG